MLGVNQPVTMYYDKEVTLHVMQEREYWAMWFSRTLPASCAYVKDINTNRAN